MFGLTFKTDAKTIAAVNAQMAVNSILGAVISFGLASYLCFYPEKDQKADPLTSFMLAAIAMSSGSGAVVSAFHLREYLKPKP